MSTPVLISDLDPVGVIDPANDLTIVHQGFTDKKFIVSFNLTVAINCSC
mgnify:CR=1 FL=1